MNDDAKALCTLAASFLGFAILFGYISRYIPGSTIGSVIMTIVFAFFFAVKLTAQSFDQDDEA